MDKDNDLQQLKAKSSMELLQKYKIKVENDKVTKKRNGSNSNQGKNQHIGSTQQQPICLSQKIGIDEGRIQKGLGNSTNSTQSLTIGGVPILVRGSTGSIEAQNKRQEGPIKTTQVSQSKDIAKSTAKSTSRAQSLTNEGVSIQVRGSKKMQGKMLDAMKPSLNNRAATNIVQSELHMKKQLRSTVGGNQSQEKMLDAMKSSLNNSAATNIVHSKIPMKRQLGSTASGNQSEGTTIEEQSLKKKRYIPKHPSMSIGEFIEKNQQPHQVEESEEENDQEQAIEGDINYGSEEVGELNENTSEGKEASKRTRGKTLCVKIHTRSANDRQEIILNELGQPIGPNACIVSQFSNFLGTIARSSDFCPLTYTSWHAVPGKDENIWAYVNAKYNVPEKGKKVVYSIIDEAWRRYKWTLKKKYFSKYKTLRERMKNRPDDIPEEHFKALMVYWSIPTVQEICQQNAQNIAQQTCRHRAGPVSFARIKEKMCASSEDGEPPSQLELFIKTRQCKNGKQSNEETNDTITKLQNLVSSGQSSSEAFQNVLGKEKPGRQRLQGRAVTTTMLKRNEEVAEMKRAHTNEMNELEEKLREEHANKMNDLEEKLQEKLQENQKAMEDKFQLILKTVLDQNNSGLNLESLAALFSTPPDATSAPRSSTSTHAPSADRENNEADVGLDGLDEEEFEDMC